MPAMDAGTIANDAIETRLASRIAQAAPGDAREAEADSTGCLRRACAATACATCTTPTPPPT